MPSSPNTIFSGTTGPESDRPGPNRVFTRILFWVIATLLFPVGAILYGAWLALFTYGRMPWWLPAPIATILTFLGLGFGWLGPEYWVAYAQGWGEFGKGVVTGNLSLGLIVDLMFNQVFLGLWLYTCYASVVTAWKWFRRPSWQERKITVGPVLARRAKKTIEAIKTGTDSPVGGLTLGVAMDKRDARFAGGKPGARYGDRVIVTDDEAAGHMLVVGGSGSGKALDVNTPIPTPTGFVRMGDLNTGDKIFGSNGQPVTVIGAFDTMNNHDCYEVVFSDGSVIVADAEHLWTVQTTPVKTPVPARAAPLQGLGSAPSSLTITTRDLVGTIFDECGEFQYSVPTAGVVLFPDYGNTADAYPLGRLAAQDPNVAITSEYLFGSEDTRWALLAGISDGCGLTRNDADLYRGTNETLCNQVIALVASLGYQASKTISGHPTNTAPQFAATILNLDTEQAKRRYITDIRKVESRPVRCIAVDAEDHLFLAGETFIATHNTTSILIMLRDAIRQGRGIVVVDCKGGPDVPQQISDWCQRYGRDFLHWSIQDPKTPYEGPADGPAFYDPISRGDPSRRKDLLIGSQRWDVEYYKTVNGNYLQTLFTVADLVPPLEGVDSFTDVADLLSANQLLRRAQNIPADLYPELASALTRLGEMEEGERSGIRNMYSRLHTLTSSTAGAWLRRDPEGLRDINLRKAADEGQVVVFSLDTSNYEETATLIAGLIIQDLKTLSSELRHEPAPGPLHVVVDEFSAVDTTNLLGLLAKARDAKMPVCLATQALADLERREPTFVDQVLGIVSAFAVHRANTETDARIYAGLSGVTRKMLERLSLEQTSSILGTFGAASATGVGYLEEKDDYAINVGTFQNLERGQAIYIAKSPTARYVNPVHVIMEDEAAADLQCDPGVEIVIQTRVKAPKKEKVTYPHPALSDMVNIFQPTEVDPAEAVGAPHNGIAPPPRPPDVAPRAPRLPTRPKMPRPMNPNAPGQPGIAAGTPLPGMGAPGVKPAGTPMPGISRPGKPSGAHDEWMMP